ncbi:MAG: DUF4258 domain-containing protein [Pseudomonadota bacterium]|nr:DUF4258 domain-containing protein [Pseudomonadota bacterium]
MSETLARVQLLVARHEIEVSAHGTRELAADSILLEEIVRGIGGAILIEDYPASFKGPSVLLLQRDGQGRPVHIVWGLTKSQSSPAVLVTAYRPDPERWSSNFQRRRT